MRMARRVELAAGVAAAVLDVLALLLLLFAPLVPACTRAGAATCPPAAVRYVPLTQAAVSAAGWAYVLSVFALIVLAAVGAVSEAWTGWRWGAGLLWAGGVLAFAGCALGAGGVGLVYLPAVLAVCLAVYGSLAGRLRAMQRGQPSVDDDARPSISGKEGPSS
jgi:hypothetical protein